MYQHIREVATVLYLTQNTPSCSSIKELNNTALTSKTHASTVGYLCCHVVTMVTCTAMLSLPSSLSPLSHLMKPSRTLRQALPEPCLGGRGYNDTL